MVEERSTIAAVCLDRSKRQVNGETCDGRLNGLCLRRQTVGESTSWSPAKSRQVSVRVCVKSQDARVGVCGRKVLFLANESALLAKLDAAGRE